MLKPSKAFRILIESLDPSNLTNRDKKHLALVIFIYVVVLGVLIFINPDFLSSRWFMSVVIIFAITIIFDYYTRSLNHLFFKYANNPTSEDVRTFIDFFIMGVIIFFVILIIFLLLVGVPWPTLFGFYLAVLFLVYLAFFEEKMDRTKIIEKKPKKKKR